MYPVLFINLRGTALTFTQQMQFLRAISDVFIVLSDSPSKDSARLLSSLNKHALIWIQTDKVDKFELQSNKCVMPMMSKSEKEVSPTLAFNLGTILNNIAGKIDKTLKERIIAATPVHVELDDKYYCKINRRLTRAVGTLWHDTITWESIAISIAG